MKKSMRLMAVATALLAICSCRKDSVDPTIYKPFDKVMILCAPAFNNLSSDIKSNIRTICSSKLPLKSSNKAILLFVHNSVGDYEFTTLTRPCIIRVYADWSGKAVMDTLKTFPEESKMTDPAMMKEGLQYIADNFKSVSYGMIFSSHSTGWLPEGYYEKNPGKATMRLVPVHGMPKTKSLGMECRKVEGKTVIYETDIPDFREGIPMHLEYIIFDSCLAGGVEVAYELRDKADRIAFSQAEVLSSGMNYSNVTDRLLSSADPDLKGFCEDYFNQYDKESGSRRSATISLVNTTRLAHLAYVCNSIFENNRAAIAKLKSSDVQRFDRLAKHVLFDLEDIIRKAGASDDEMALFKLAMEACIEYKAATPMILNEFQVNSFCGLSSYMPGQGDSTALHPFYRTLAWNKAAGLVK